LIESFPSDTTLWLVLRKFESIEGKNYNFTARGIAATDSGTSGSGRIVHEMPLLQILGREAGTFKDLQKTLAQFGINSGSVLIRLNYRKTEQPLEEAMLEIGRYFEDTIVDDTEAVTSNSSPSKVERVSEAIAKLPESEISVRDVEMTTDDAPTDSAISVPPLEAQEDAETTTEDTSKPLPVTAKAPLETIADSVGPGGRAITVFSAPSSATPSAAAQPFDEDDYTPSIAQFKRHQSRLDENSKNKPLLSDAELKKLEDLKEAKLASVKTVAISIRFPDQTRIQSNFTSEDTGKDLYEFATSVIVAQEQPFKLVWTEGRGSQTVPKDTTNLIRQLGFAGRMLVNFHWGDTVAEKAKAGPTLKSEHVRNARPLVAPEIPVLEEEDGDKPATIQGGNLPAGGGKGKSKGGLNNFLKHLSKK
jgi:tether containing UBX domain for GLUT4